MLHRVRISKLPAKNVAKGDFRASTYDTQPCCWGTHCSLIKREERETVPAEEIEVKGKMRKRIEWRGQNESQRGRKDKRKWQTCWCCRDQQRACRMVQPSAGKLEHSGPAEKEWPQCHKGSSWEVR